MILRRLWHALLTASVAFALSTQSRVAEQLGDDLTPAEDYGAGILLTPNGESSIALRVDRSQKITTSASSDTHDLSKLPSPYQAPQQSAIPIKRVSSDQRPMTNILRQAVVSGRTYALWLMRKDEIGQSLWFDTADFAANGWSNKVIYGGKRFRFPQDLSPVFKELELSRDLTKIPLCMADQDESGKTRLGEKFVRTDAKYHNYINFDKGVIITHINVSPETSENWNALPEEFYKPPPLRRYSDVTTLQWIHFMKERQTTNNRVRWWFFHGVVDATTKQIMADILAGEQKKEVGPGEWPGLEYTYGWAGDLDSSYGISKTDDYAMALLGSPEGRALTETIAAHAHVFSNAYLPSKVHFFVSTTTKKSGAERTFTNLAFYIRKLGNGESIGHKKKKPASGSGAGEDVGEGSSKGAGVGSSEGTGSASEETSDDDSSDVSDDESGDVSGDNSDAQPDAT